MFFSQIVRSRSVGPDRRQPGRARGRARGRQPMARKLALEVLEDRRLLSIDIQWHNRGVFSAEPFIIPPYTDDLEPDDADTPDNFYHVFGSLEENARNVVDAALAAWERLIPDFNDPNNEDNVYTVTIVMDTENNGAGAHARTPGAGDPANGIPDEGAIIINANNGGADWFLDFTPDESSEFTGTLINAFCGNAQAGSPALGLFDLFSTVAHEMTHLLGMSWDEDFLWEDMADDDSDPAIQPTGLDDAALTGDRDGDLWRYDDGGVKALFTTYNASSPNNGNSGFPIHIAQPHAQNVFQDFYGARDLGNAIGGDSQRRLPSLLLGRYLQEVYGYDLTFHEAFPNFYIQLGKNVANNGRLLVRGGGVGEAIYSPPLPATGDSDDVITLSSQGSDLVVEVDIGTDVPGTGIDTYFTQEYPIGDVASIEIFGYDGVTMSGGDDVITLDFSNEAWYQSMDITVDGGDGVDQLIIKGPPGDGHSYEVRTSCVLIDGVRIDYLGVEELTLMAEPDSTSNTMLVTGTGSDLKKLILVGSDAPDAISVVAAGSALEDLEINALKGDDVIDVEDPGPNAVLKVDAGWGDDQVTLGAAVGTLDGFGVAKLHRIDGWIGDQDVLLLQDFNTTADTLYSFDVDYPPDCPAGEGIIIRHSSQFFLHRHMDLVTLDAGSGNDAFSIAGTPVDGHLTVLANDGDDEFSVGSNDFFPNVGEVSSLVAIHGGLGTNTATVDDTGDNTGDTVTITETSVGAGPFDDFFGYHGKLEYYELDELTIHTTWANDVIDVESTAKRTETFIYAGRGDDAILVAGPPDPAGNPGGGQGQDERPGTVDHINSILTVEGEIGTDSLTVNDTSDLSGDRVTVTDSTVGMDPLDTFFGPGGGLVYRTVEGLVLQLGAGHDDAFVESIHLSTPTYIQCGKGDDDVVVKNAAGTANDVCNRLDVYGHEGHDTLILEDGSEPLPAVVTVSWKDVGAEPGDTYFNGGGFVTYSELEELTVNAGTSGDTIYVTGTSPGTETRIHGGGGIDLITVEYNGTVDVVRSLLRIDGGGGPTNALALIDSADAAPEQVSITDCQVGMEPGDGFFGQDGGLVYDNLTQLNLVSGLAGDTIHVRSTHPGTKLLLGGGGGDDVFYVDSNGQAPGGTVDLIASRVTLYGGLGTNVLVLDDSSDLSGDTVTITPSAAQAGHVGLGASDDFFGPGGSLAYNELVAVVLRTSDTAADVINAAPSPTLGGTQFAIDAQGPTSSDAPPGDRLNLDLLGVSQRKLTVLSFGIGVLESSSHASIRYADVEAVDTLTDPTFDLVLDMNAPLLPGNDAVDDQIRAFRGVLVSGERTLELVVNGATAFVGVEAAIKSLTVLGSSDGDDLSIPETPYGLPSFPGVAQGSHTNAAFLASGLAPTNVGIHFDGGPGAGSDRVDLALLMPHDVAYFADSIGAPNSGVVNVQGVFTLSFESLTPLFFTAAGGSVSVDATLLRDLTALVLTNLGGGVWQVSGDGGFETVIFSGFDDVAVDPAPSPTVVGRHVFYNNSKFDGNNPAANAADDAAIDPAKEALLPGGGKAAFANYTSFSRGLNGIMIDVFGLPASTLGAADFVFRYGNTDTPSRWARAANPATIAVRAGAGACGSDRVTLIWPDRAVPNANWLQVTVLANDRTGLAANDVLYFGCAIGEVGNSTADAKVNSQDVTRIRNNYTGFGTVGIESVYDFNRDRKVNSQDVTICRNYYSGFTPLRLITPPASAPAALGGAPLLAAAAAHDAVLRDEPAGWDVRLYADLAWAWELGRAKPKPTSSEADCNSLDVRQGTLADFPSD